MPAHTGPTAIADTMKKNSLYLISVGAVGVLLGRFAIDAAALVSAGLATIVIAVGTAIVGFVLSRRVGTKAE